MANISDPLRAILNEAGVPTLYARFTQERVDKDSIQLLSDEDLTRLGVSTIGDRIRVREAAKRAYATSQNGASNEPGTSAAQFPGFRSISFSGGRVTPGKKKKVVPGWTGNFFCLSSRLQSRTPNACEKEVLNKTGLGGKKIRMANSATEEEVISHLQSEDVFPKLKQSKGFELLRTQQNGRQLVQIKAPWSSMSLKTNVGSQARIYIRPIQKDLPVDPVEEEEEPTVKVACEKCNLELPVHTLREHVQICEHNDITYPDADSDLPVFLIYNQNLVPLPNDEAEDPVDLDPRLDPPLHVEPPPPAATFRETINQCIDFCTSNQLSNPVEILNKLQAEIVQGRPLDVEDANDALEGETTFITVDRDHILETSFEEIGSIEEEELRKTLEVQFYGEMASDYGGPRKEFFRLALLAIKEKYFDNGVRQLLAPDYRLVGIILALSILQNGKMPNFLAPELVDDIFSHADSTEAVKNLREGLNLLGIYELFMRLPALRFLLQPSNISLTVKRLTTLLRPVFSDEGSNAYVFEKATYSLFIKYMREVAAGRRRSLTLGSILVFVCSTDEEPLLGFKILPTIKFCEASNPNGFIPTASTCVNSLTLPRATPAFQSPGQEELFSLYDYAFANSYYGLQ